VVPFRRLVAGMSLDDLVAFGLPTALRTWVNASHPQRGTGGPKRIL
jgi:hypothetical protein